MFDSTDDKRVDNSPTRHQYRELSEHEKAVVRWYKDTGITFINYLTECGDSREFSIARTKMEEAVMWAVRGVTA